MRAFRDSRLMRATAVLAGAMALVAVQALLNQLVGVQPERGPRADLTLTEHAPQGTRRGALRLSDAGMPIAGPAEYGVKYYMLMPVSPRPVRGVPSVRPDRRVIAHGNTVIEYASDGVTVWKRDQVAPGPGQP